MTILKHVQDALLVYAAVGSSWYLLKWVAHSLSWWNDSERDYHSHVLKLKFGKRTKSAGALSAMYEQPIEIPVLALETFYIDGGPELQNCVAGLLQQFYTSNKSIIGLLRHRLKSANVDDRLGAITVLEGFLYHNSAALQKTPQDIEHRRKVFDGGTIQSLVEGLFQSLEPTTCNSPKEYVYRREALKIVDDLCSNQACVNDKDHQHRFSLALVTNGLLQFFQDYDTLAREYSSSSSNRGPQHQIGPADDNEENYMPLLESLVIFSLKETWSNVFFRAVVVNEVCKLGLINWEDYSDRVEWTNTHQRALRSMVAEGIYCEHQPMFKPLAEEEEDRLVELMRAYTQRERDWEG